MESMETGRLCSAGPSMQVCQQCLVSLTCWPPPAENGGIQSGHGDSAAVSVPTLVYIQAVAGCRRQGHAGLQGAPSSPRGDGTIVATACH